MKCRVLPAIIGLCVISLFGAMVQPGPIGAAASNQVSTPRPTPKPAYVCRVTLPNDDMPPNYDLPPFPPGHLGNGKLGTSLWPNGIVLFTPDLANPTGPLEMKWGWWRGVKGQLTITGKRLDAPAPPLRAEIPAGYGDRGFQVSGIIFPTEGCWQVTGNVGSTSLTFVTLVLRSPAYVMPATPQP